MASEINNIKKVIMQRISDDVPDVQDVSNFEKTNFKGFPAVNVFCSGNENDYWSTAENKRIYTFIIRIYQQIEYNVPNITDLADSAKQAAEDAMGVVVSEIIDSFDKFEDMGGMIDGEIAFSKAVPSAWGYAQIGTGWARTAEIKIIVNKIFNITI